MARLVDEFEDVAVFFDLENLRLHCGFTKEVLEQEQSDFKKRFDKKIKELSGEAKERYLEYQGDNHFYLFDVFPSFQWLSLFNTAYSVFEKSMNYICRLAERKTNTSFELNDLQGRGINRAKLYLNKAANITEPFNNHSWGKIQEYAKLRNVMAHATGELDLSNGKHVKVLDYATRHPSINVIRHNGNSDFPEVQLEPEIVFEAIQEYKNFLELLSKHELPV